MKTLKCVLTIAALGLIVFVLGLWLLSPYKSGRDPGIISEVFIDTPCDYAFEYLGNSDHARDWSVFVDFIETINSDMIPDGEVGSKRVCYTESDKSGFNWEEEVLEVVVGNYRKISCYNYKELIIAAPELVTEQIYKKKDGGCRLLFTLEFRSDPTFLDLLKMKFSAYRVQKIFDANLENIGTEVLTYSNSLDQVNNN